jgi:hypothetical protein
VIEPYRNARILRNIQPAAVTLNGTAADDFAVRALKVERIDGRTDYVISALDSQSLFMIDGRIPFKGTFGIYSEKNGKPVYAYLNDGTVLGTDGHGIKTEANITGKVSDFTRELSRKNTITVQVDSAPLDTSRVIGRDIYVHNDGRRSAVYRIEDADSLGEGKYRLHLGEQTLIRSYVSDTDLSKGFVYDIAPGHSFYIPLSQEVNL